MPSAHRDNENEVGRLREVQLTPGMPVDVNIFVGQRALLSSTAAARQLCERTEEQ